MFNDAVPEHSECKMLCHEVKYNAGMPLSDSAQQELALEVLGAAAVVVAPQLVAGRIVGVSTVRTEAGNLAEQLTLSEAQGGAGTRIMANKINDPKFNGNDWAKMSHTHTNPGGSTIEIHYWKNLSDGIRTGFKFKN